MLDHDALYVQDVRKHRGQTALSLILLIKPSCDTQVSHQALKSKIKMCAAAS